MRPGMVVFRLVLVAGWLLIFTISVQAIRQMGASAPWRAQFNGDFGLHLLLVATWLVYRARSPWLGLFWAGLAILMGGVFTLAYLLVVSFLVKGEVRKLLLGRHADPVPG